MQAIELELDIDESREIQLKLPHHVSPGKARVLVFCEQPDAHADAEQTAARRRLKFGQFPGAATMSPDFDDPLPDEFWLSGDP
ncbi:hypothetical protein [uncultured Thiohalocapsa sp.]|uniref:hypothetical protein n=1 Tax=uncultured Thiohalocapsa sp. TaxID=768990 RepID=UPI0025EC48A2|nr:hypothetical protein [uncultured Thiohalocapsa sp.]